MTNTIQIIYRTSSGGYLKEKPDYITNKNCFLNLLDAVSEGISYLPNTTIKTMVIADNCHSEELQLIRGKNSNESTIPIIDLHEVNVGHGAGTFNIALDYALKLNDDDIVYFVENDYVHHPDSFKVLNEAFELGSDYVTLYDHPDKYLDQHRKPSYLYVTKSCHWRLTPSTTMTFAAKVKTLREDEPILRKFTMGSYPHDHEMFLTLNQKNRSLISPIPGFSTHGETQWLSPFRDWKSIIGE